MHLSQIESLANAADGWLNSSEGKLLYRLARRCPSDGVIVEIGSWKGKSTIWLGHGSRAGANVEVHAVDPHTGSPEHQRGPRPVWTFDEFRGNITQGGVGDVVVPHIDYSVSAAERFTKPVGCIFIDGQHEYEAVRADFEAWFPKVMEGGTMAFHDTTGRKGPRRVALDALFESRQFKKVRFVRSIIYGIKTRENTWLERAENQLWLGLFFAYEWAYGLQWKIRKHLFRRIPSLVPTPA